MRLILYRLTFHENLFFATREAGRLYETGRFLHNYALTYALGLARAPYFHAQQVPHYADDLEALNLAGIYVTPARGIEITFELTTFKYADNAYHVEMGKTTHNTPSFGRAKEIAQGSCFEFALLAAQPPALPRWVRMGLWRSKALLERVGETDLKAAGMGLETASLPLNPLDLSQGEFKVFDLIAMPPASLLENVQVQTDWLAGEVAGRKLLLPEHMAYLGRSPQKAQPQ